MTRLGSVPQSETTNSKKSLPNHDIADSKRTSMVGSMQGKPTIIKETSSELDEENHGSRATIVVTNNKEKSNQKNGNKSLTKQCHRVGS